VSFELARRGQKEKRRQRRKKATNLGDDDINGLDGEDGILELSLDDGDL